MNISRCKSCSEAKNSTEKKSHSCCSLVTYLRGRWRHRGGEWDCCFMWFNILNHLQSLKWKKNHIIISSHEFLSHLHPELVQLRLLRGILYKWCLWEFYGNKIETFKNKILITKRRKLKFNENLRWILELCECNGGKFNFKCLNVHSFLQPICYYFMPKIFWGEFMLMYNLNFI